LTSATALAGAALFPSLAQAQSVWGGTGSSNTLTLLPSASYFIAPNVSVGAGLIVQHGSTSVNAGIVSVNVDQTAIGLLVMGGYNIHLTPGINVDFIAGLRPEYFKVRGKIPQRKSNAKKEIMLFNMSSGSLGPRQNHKKFQLFKLLQLLIHIYQR